MSNMWLKLFVVILVLAGLASSQQQDTTSNKKYDRETMASLSKLFAESKHLELAGRCDLFEEKLRELSDKAPEMVSRSDLFGTTTSYLRARRLPFSNSQPVLDLLLECQQKYPETNRPESRGRDVIATPLRDQSQNLDHHHDSPMDEVHREFGEIKNKIKDHGQDLYGPDQGGFLHNEEYLHNHDDDNAGIEIDVSSDAGRSNSGGSDSGRPIVGPLGGRNNLFEFGSGPDGNWETEEEEEEGKHDSGHPLKRIRSQTFEFGATDGKHLLKKPKFSSSNKNLFGSDHQSERSFDVSSHSNSEHRKGLVDRFLRDEHLLAAIEREQDPLKKLAMKLQLEQKLVHSLRNELASSESEMGQLTDRLHDLESQVEAILLHEPENKEEREKYQQLKALHSHSLDKQHKLERELDEASRRITELEAARREELISKSIGNDDISDDDDDDESEKSFGDFLEDKLKKKNKKKDKDEKNALSLEMAGLKLLDKIPSSEQFENRCQKYYIVFNKDAKKRTKEFVKTVAKLELPQVMRFSPADEFYNDLQQFSRELSGSSKSKKIRKVLAELEKCLALTHHRRQQSSPAPQFVPPQVPAQNQHEQLFHHQLPPVHFVQPNLQQPRMLAHQTPPINGQLPDYRRNYAPPHLRHHQMPENNHAQNQALAMAHASAQAGGFESNYHQDLSPNDQAELARRFGNIPEMPTRIKRRFSS